MKVIKARNVQQALPSALAALLSEGIERASRNGPVLLFKEPVTTVYERPTERVIFWTARDANPFFHLHESLWMLGGRNDVESVARYVANMRSFSDDGVTFHGAYGHRWINHFGSNQLQTIVEALRANPDDRRQVLSMWDARADLGRAGKDLPCNLQALFSVNSDGALDMLVTNRSNDMVWGAYGANAVHFSFLQEYMALQLGREVGAYRQMSNNFHTYKSILPQVASIAEHAPNPLGAPTVLDPYAEGAVRPFPLMSSDLKTWSADLDLYLTNSYAIGFHDPFFRKVASPMALAYERFKTMTGLSRYNSALEALGDVKAEDWRLAGTEWILRRREKFLNPEPEAS